MIKKNTIIALVIYLFLTVLSPGLVQAQTGISILDSSVQAEFPGRLNFSLSARSDVNITDIRLYYVFDRVSYAEVTSEVYVEFEPSPDIGVEWSLDMRRASGTPPGSSLEYWWTVTDDSGNMVETDPAGVQYDDLRYPWRSLTEGKVTIYWYEGGDSFAREMMLAAHRTLSKLADDTGAVLEKPAKLYIYSSFQDLQGAMVFPRELTGARAYPEYGITVLGIAPDAIQWGRMVIAHELTHLVIHQVTLNAYNQLPVWLDEGLAMYAEGLLESGYVAYLTEAIAEDNLITVRSLSSPFSAYAEESLLSYAQSYSVIEFLISQYGQEKMLELLNTFKQGSGYDAALEKVYGFDMDGLNNLWRGYATKKYQPTEEAGMPLALIIMIAVLAIGILFTLGFVGLKLARRRG